MKDDAHSSNFKLHSARGRKESPKCIVCTAPIDHIRLAPQEFRIFDRHEQKKIIIALGNVEECASKTEMEF